MINQLISKSWALEERFHTVQANLIMRRLARGEQALVIPDTEKPAPYATEPLAGFRDNNGIFHPWNKAAARGRSVAIIPIMGVMSRYGDMCSYGSEDIAGWIMEANAMDEIAAIVLEINSPGGQVDGTEMLGQVVKQSQKPVVAWVAGMAASAAYWVASQASEIMMESETSSEVGSIGVLAMHVDASGYYEKEGFKVSIIRADGSEQKALFNDAEPLTEAVLSDTKAVLNPIRSSFVATVKSGRPKISDGVFSGKMYGGKEAIRLGMADRIGFLGDAVNRAAYLAGRTNQ